MIEPTKIIRCKRKSIALIINNQAQLIVRAPKLTKDETIFRLIASKQKWIEQKQQIVNANNIKYAETEYKNGDVVLFLGKNYTLEFANIKEIIFSESKLYAPIKYQNNAKNYFIKWYKQQATQILQQRLQLCASNIGANFATFSLTNARCKWGSCSAKQDIKLSWRLVMCPMFVVDYVVAHEVCHLQFKNHQKEFWRKVAQIYPNYKTAEKWLKSNFGLIKNL
ncbi:MAG: SprT family zinc-dependent metalloprotease [Clostridia bacterium]